jgi:hypothetical protein
MIIHPLAGKPAPQELLIDIEKRPGGRASGHQQGPGRVMR